MKKIFTIVLLICVATFINAQTAIPPAAGDGSSGNPYQIATLDNLYWLTQNDTEWDKYFIQTADIDATSTSTWDGGQGFQPIGVKGGTEFGGVYNGAGHTVSNIFINRSNVSGGFFGYIRSANISKLTISNITVTGGTNTGALVGESRSSTIDSCSTSGIVMSFWGGYGSYCGGIVGKHNTGSVLKNSFSSCTVGSGTLSESAGGLVGGLFSADIYNSYGTGNVQATKYAGGVVGYCRLSCNIENCYSLGTTSGTVAGGFLGQMAGTITACYWNTETSGTTQATGYGSHPDITGLTTSEMKNQSSFSGWDFPGKWKINPDNNDGYPYLSWQLFPTVYPMPLSDWALYFVIVLVAGVFVVRYFK